MKWYFGLDHQVPWRDAVATGIAWKTGIVIPRKQPIFFPQTHFTNDWENSVSRARKNLDFGSVPDWHTVKLLSLPSKPSGKLNVAMKPPPRGMQPGELAAPRASGIAIRTPRPGVFGTLISSPQRSLPSPNGQMQSSPWVVNISKKLF